MSNSDSSASQGSLPSADGRKILVIGIGSTGARVCNQILERLSWTFNSPNNVPWLKCLVLETEEVSAERPIRTFARYVHLGIDRDNYSALVRNPANYQDKLAFSDWDIPRMTGAAEEITTGANNNRVLGRLSLLFPENIDRVRSNITELLDDLNSMSDQDASKQFQKANGQPIDIKLGSQISIYVVGTLCGGTASGCFIDMGYLLQSLQGYASRTTLNGLFMLPPAQSNDNRICANAYAALVELNHYSTDGTRYEVQYPWTPGTRYRPGASVRPYTNLYLLQCRGSAKSEYAKLVSATADYIYSDVLGKSAAIRDGKRTNITDDFVQRDFWGATQKFFTMGLSSIEFPFAKVMKVCSVRLTMKGFQLLAGGDAIGGATRAQIPADIPLLDRKRLVDRLLIRQGDDIATTFSRILSASYQAGLHSDEALRTARSQADAAFGEGGTAGSDLPQRIVPLTVEANTRAAETELLTALRSTAEGYLSGSDVRGIQALISFLDATLTHITAAQAETLGATPESVGRLKQDMASALSQLEECRSDFFLGVVGQRPAAVRRYARQFVGLGQEYCKKQLSLSCAAACKSIYTAAAQNLERWKARLENNANGMKSEVLAIARELNELQSRTDVVSGSSEDGWERVVNGDELYAPGKTVDEEYQAALQAPEARRGTNVQGDWRAVEALHARQSVGEYVADCTADLFAPHFESRRFDVDRVGTPRKRDDQDLLDLTDYAKERFDALKRRSLTDRLLVRDDKSQLLTNAAKSSALFLDWNANHPRYRATTQKSYGFVFFNDQDPQAAQLRELLQREQIINTNCQAISTADPFQLLILREQGAFSLGTVAVLDDDSVSSWRTAYDDDRTIGTYHSRGDVPAWIGWDKKNAESLRRVRGSFLMAVALGIIEFVSAGRFVFRYPKRSPADPGFTEVTNDLDSAVQKLNRGGFEGLVNVRIRERRLAMTPEEVLGRMERLIDGGEFAFMESDHLVSKNEIDAYLREHIENDMELLGVYNAKYPDNVADTCRRMVDGKPTYYCPNPKCGSKLGYVPEALYIYDSRTGRRTRKCLACKEDIDQFVSGQVLA